MARLGRGQPQSFTSASQSHLRGPFRPAPVVLVPAVELSLRKIRVTSQAIPNRLSRITRRGPDSVPPWPQVIFGLPPAPPIRVELTAVVKSRRSPLRGRIARLGPPLVVTLPLARPGIVKTVAVQASRRSLLRRTESRLPLVIPVSTASFSGPRTKPVRIRPPRRRIVLGPPVVTSTATFAGPRVLLARQRRPEPFSVPPFPVVIYGAAPARPTQVTVAHIQPRPRRTSYSLRPPTVVAVTVSYAAAAHLARIRPRRTVSRLTAVTYAATSSIRVALVRARPHPKVAQLKPPTVLQIFGPPVEVEVDVKTPIQRLRQQPHSRLRPPVFYASTSQIQVRVVRTGPRRTAHALTAVIYATSSTIRSSIVRTRPRPTTRRLSRPLFIAATSTIQVRLVRTRPRPTTRRLSPPFFYAATSTIRAKLTRIRPPRTHAALAAPTALQVFTGLKVALAHTRPRPTTRFIVPPLVKTFPPVVTTLTVKYVQTRPRHTIYVVRPPATLTPFIVELREETILVKLIHTRPRHRTAFLRRPVSILSVSFTGPEVAQVRTRPRPTRHTLSPPTAVTTAAVLYPIAVKLVTIRPRPTAVLLAPPTALAVFAGPSVALTHARPRPTRHFLSPPTVVEVPSVEQREETITVALVRTRPPFRHATLQPPTVLAVFSGPEVTLARIRPRPTRHLLRPPTVIRVPSVEQLQQTIRVTLARTRPRHTVHALKPGIVKPFVSATVSETLIKTRPRPTVYRLAPPTAVRVPAVEQQQRTVGIHLTHTRPRPTTKFLRPPTAVTTPQPPAIPYRVKVVIPVEPRRPVPHSHIFPPPIVPPAPPPVAAGGGAYRSFKPRLLTADDVRRLLAKHDGILVKERLSPEELRTLEEMKLTGYIVADELSEEEEIEVLRMLGWL